MRLLFESESPVVDMKHSPSTSDLGVSFNRFLYATLRLDADSDPLSVVSALARLDKDPWVEAAALAALPAPTAEQRLSTLLGSLPELKLERADLGKVVAHLVGLLPTSPAASKPSGLTAHPWDKAKASQQRVLNFAMLITAIAVIFGLLAANQHEAPNAPGPPDAPISSAPHSR